VQIFSMYLVYDTQIIVGGEHKSYQFDMDDYVLAALVIYLDIINLFILLLQLLNGGRRD
jgi:FtsH-binding integral membrane protein